MSLPEGQPEGRAEDAAARDAAIRRILEPDARARLSNIKMVRPDLAAAVENYLLGMGAQGRLSSQVTDAQLKQILLSAQQPKRDFKMSRV